MPRLLKTIHKVFISIKIDLRDIFASILELPRYLKDRLIYSRLQGNHRWLITSYPIFLDRKTESASLGEYFWQDLLVAKEVIKQSPVRHVDVGSRVDGFIAHLACTRKVEVFDIRPLTAIIENVQFTQWDITNPNPSLNGSADCVSCLHTLEHIGLGRYGDKLDPDGWKKGLKSLADLVAPAGALWLSIPIGIQRVEFNAHRVFDPSTIINTAKDFEMTLERFFFLTDAGVIESKNIASDIAALAELSYGLGIFLFLKD